MLRKSKLKKRCRRVSHEHFMPEPTMLEVRPDHLHGEWGVSELYPHVGSRIVVAVLMVTFRTAAEL